MESFRIYVKLLVHVILIETFLDLMFISVLVYYTIDFNSNYNKYLLYNVLLN